MKETSLRSPQSPPSSYQSQVAAKRRDKVKFRDKGTRSMGCSSPKVGLAHLQTQIYIAYIEAVLLIMSITHDLPAVLTTFSGREEFEMD